MSGAVEKVPKSGNSIPILLASGMWPPMMPAGHGRHAVAIAALSRRRHGSWFRLFRTISPRVNSE